MDSLEVKPLLSSELFGERHPAARLDLPSLSGADRWDRWRSTISQWWQWIWISSCQREAAR